MGQSLILGPDGRPISSKDFNVCPNCGAPKDKWVPSCGFGIPHYVCNECGYEMRDKKCPVVSP